MLSIPTVHVKKNTKRIQKKKTKKEREWSWINEVLVWRLGLVEDLVDFVLGLLSKA